jgi:hypothetical protein
LHGFRETQLSEDDGIKKGIYECPTLPDALKILGDCARYFIYRVPAELPQPVTPTRTTGSMDIDDQAISTSALTTTSSPRTGLATIMVNARYAKASNAIGEGTQDSVTAKTQGASSQKILGRIRGASRCYAGND